MYLIVITANCLFQALLVVTEEGSVLAEHIMLRHFWRVSAGWRLTPVSFRDYSHVAGTISAT